MLGKGHCLSAVATWLAGCAAVDAVHPLGAGPVVAGTVIAAGFALVPDLDHPGSTVTRTLGPLTRLLSYGVASGSAAARKASCRCCVTDRSGCHRTATHTAAFAVALGMVAAVAGWLAPRVALPAVVGLSAWLACHTALSSTTRAKIGDMVLPGRFRRHGRWAHRFTGSIGALIVGGLAGWVATGYTGAAWWLGVAVGWGTFAHSAGDSLTHWGSPLWWPLRIRGCRWTCVGTPRWMRFGAGSRVERWLVVPAFWAVGIAAAYWLI